MTTLLRLLNQRKIELREYQQKGCDRVLRELAEGKDTIFYLPTGGGKTESAIGGLIDVWTQETDELILFIVNRLTLVDQSVHRFEKYGYTVGIIQGNNRIDLTKQIQVCSIQTLVRRLPRLLRNPDFNVAKIVIDECHNSTADSYSMLFSIYGKQGKIVGLSASPMVTGKYPKNYSIAELRGERKCLGDRFQSLVEGTTPKHLRDLGYLSEVTVHSYAVSYDRSKLRMDSESGDFIYQDIARVMNDDQITKLALDEYKEKGINQNGELMPALLFAVSIEHATQVAKYFDLHGNIKTAVVTCETPDKERQQIFKDFATGIVKVLCSVNVVSEGFDMPSAVVGICLRPTASLRLLIQQLGRLLRPHPSKERAIILDLADNCQAITGPELKISRGFHPYDDIDLSKCLVRPKPPEKKEKPKTDNEAPGQIFKVSAVLEYEKEKETWEEKCLTRLMNYWAKTQDTPKPYKKYWVAIQLAKKIPYPSKKICKQLGTALGYSSSWSGYFYQKAWVYYDLQRDYEPTYKLDAKSLAEVQNWLGYKKIANTKVYDNDYEKHLDILSDRFQLDLTPNYNNYKSQLQLALKQGGKVNGQKLLKKIYRRLALALHPDVNPDSPRGAMAMLNKAYEFLLDKGKVDY